MSDILDEIKDAIAEKRLNKIIGVSTIALFSIGVVVIISLGISSWYQSQQNELIQQDGALLTEVVNSINNDYFQKVKSTETDKKVSEQNKEKIAKLEALAERNSSAYSALANFYLATVSVMEGNQSKAIYYYQRVATGSYDETLKEYAQLVLLNLKVGGDEVLYGSVSDQIKEYFNSYQENGKIHLKNKKFSNAMAFTGLAISDQQNDQKGMKLYLNAMEERDIENEHVNFVIDLASQYYKSKYDNTTNTDGTK